MFRAYRPTHGPSNALRSRRLFKGVNLFKIKWNSNILPMSKRTQSVIHLWIKAGFALDDDKGPLSRLAVLKETCMTI